LKTRIICDFQGFMVIVSPMLTSTPDISDDEIFGELREATAGLLYPSESDEPFHVFMWKATQTDALRQIAALGKTAEPVSETSLDEFFAELLTGDDAEAYAHLREVLAARLSGVRVLRIGEIEVDVYLIGRAKSGAWAGLLTKSIET
jgi:hypothetical protein